MTHSQTYNKQGLASSLLKWGEPGTVDVLSATGYLCVYGYRGEDSLQSTGCREVRSG